MTRMATTEISIIVPKEATNLVTNPSFEIDASGYSAVGAGVSIARVLTQMRRGVASCEVTTASGVVSGLYYTIALTSGVQYSFSADALDVLGQTYNLFIADAGGALKSTNVTWVGTGYWKRRSVTWTADASANFRLYITRAAIASTAKFYVDGFQLETGAVSSYIDGDLTGFVVGQAAYRWNGTRHASASWRSGQTRSGGTFVKISTYARILALVGLGMGQLSNIALPSTFGGAFYQNTVANVRPFSAVVNFNGAGDYAVIQRARAALINALKPDATTYRQPLTLQVDQMDSTGLEIAETLQIPAVYEGGLEGDGQGDAYNERAALNFTMYMPLLQQDGEKGVALGYQTAVANANGVVWRDSSGIWRSIGGGLAATEWATAFAKGLDGSIYIGGYFSNFGDANGDGIVKFNGSAISSLGTGANGTVEAIAVGPDGSVYIGGSFTLAGGVANTSRIAKWNGASWSALGTGAADQVVTALAFGLDGTLYAAGSFSQMGGVANTARIAKWDGANWSALGTGANNVVDALVVDKTGALYAGGLFTLMNGVANTARIAKWNGSAWTALGSGTSDRVRALAAAEDGILYAGGEIGAYQWNGQAWSVVGSPVALPTIFALETINSGLYLGGSLLTPYGEPGMLFWTRSAFIPVDIDLPGNASVIGILASDDRLFVGFSSATLGSATSATVTVPNIGTATAYPKIIFTGPGAVFQLKNYTTGKSIFFNLTLNAGEVAILDLNPVGVSFTSSFRGNIMNAILPGSNLNFELLPGANNVSCFIYGSTTAASGVAMTWRDWYWSIDGAVR